MNLTRITSILFIGFAGVLLLVYGKALMIPFLFAILFWFFVRQIKYLVDRIPWIRDHVANWIKTTFASLLIFAIAFMIAKTLTESINDLVNSYSRFEPNLQNVMQRIESEFGVDMRQLASEHLGKLDFGLILGSLFNTLTDLLGNTLLIIFYALFIFIEEASFQRKLRGVFPDDERYDSAVDILQKVERSVTRYTGMKTMVSLLTGFLSYIVLLFSGIESPLFWAFIIFFMNFIPTIGSIVATCFPALFSIIQFGEPGPFILILAGVGAIQVVVGNVVEPRLMGNSLNISPLVAILSLSFWGAIWGITGMILSVPLTVIIVIVFSHFPKTKIFAILLSEKGTV